MLPDILKESFEGYGMFIVFWNTGSHFFQSDPNKDSDSTAFIRKRTLIGSELHSARCSLIHDFIFGAVGKADVVTALR